MVEDIWRADLTDTTNYPLAAIPWWARGRWYFRPSIDDTALYDSQSATLMFPDSCLGQSVRIEYVGRGGKLYTEVYTLGEHDPFIDLENPVPHRDPADSASNPSAEILSVSGVSLKGFATWFNTGRLRKAVVETILTAELDPILAARTRPAIIQE